MEDHHGKRALSGIDFRSLLRLLRLVFPLISRIPCHRIRTGRAACVERRNRKKDEDDWIND